MVFFSLHMALLLFHTSSINGFLRWVANGEVTSSSVEHIPTHSRTIESMVSISSLPFNCSQLEHVALWRSAAAAATHGHACMHAHARRTFCGEGASRCAQGSSVSVQFVSEPWVMRTQSFHRLSSECEPQLSPWRKMRLDTPVTF